MKTNYMNDAFVSNISYMHTYNRARIDLEKEKMYKEAIPYACSVAFSRIINLHQIDLIENCQIGFEKDFFEKEVDDKYKNAIIRNLKRIGLECLYPMMIEIIVKQYLKSKSPKGADKIVDIVQTVLERYLQSLENSVLYFRCPSCNQRYQGDKSNIMQKLTCHFCKKTITLTLEF